MRGGGLQNQRQHPKIWINYVAVHPTAVPENYSSSRMLKILTNTQTVCILSNVFEAYNYTLLKIIKGAQF